MTISYSAPAKVILSGEHSVVHNEPAVACSLGFRLQFNLIPNKQKPKKIEDNILFVEQIVKDYLFEKKLDFEDKNYFYKIESQIPQSQGFGSSAAFCVAVCACFLEFYRPDLTQNFEEFKKIVNNLATKAEKKFHENPSGIDTAVSCFGGLIYFRKEFDFLKSVSPLSFGVPETISDKLYLINSGQRKETTAELVVSVQEKLDENWAMYRKIFRDIGKITKNLVLSLKDNQEKSFEDNLVKNHKNLLKLDVVSPKAVKIIKELENFGVGKITGAGGFKEGSGFLLFYNSGNNSQSLEKYLIDHKHLYFKFAADNQGLKRE